MRTCTKCGEQKPASAFSQSGDRGNKRRPHSWCNTCRRIQNKVLRDRKLTQYREAAYRRRLERDYGITFEDYQKLLQAQDGVCAVCKQPERRRSRGRVLPLCVDHDHATGAVRGLLCSRCNTALGMAEDDEFRLIALADYLLHARLEEEFALAY